MATWDDVREAVRAVPEVEEVANHGHDATLAWKVRGKAFAWQRPLRKRDLAELGDDAPDGPVLCVRVADIGVKDALVADDPEVFFTTAHFDGFPAVLVRLEHIGASELSELLVEGWLDRAPKRLAKDFRPTG